ncbi:hypothetical protein DFH94DRAFT_706150, partial [Russula ochroleuca]
PRSDYRRVERKARLEAMKDSRSAYMYTFVNAWTGSTYCRHSNSQSTLFSVKLPSPVLAAHLEVQTILHKDGELPAASAAPNVSMLCIMLTASTCSIKAVAKATATALVVTPDTFLLGCFIAGVGVQVGTFDPVFMQRMGSDGLAPGFPTRLGCAHAGFALGTAWQREGNSGAFRSLTNNHPGGIAAMDARVNGIVVSNHGGRQVEGAVGSFSALEKIIASSKVRRAQEQGKFTVLFDLGHPHGE